MCICMYVFMYFRTYVCMYVCACMYVCTYVCMHACMYVCMYTYMYAYVHIYVQMYIYICIHKCIFRFIHICIHRCIHICIHAQICIYTHTCSARQLESASRVLPAVPESEGCPCFQIVLADGCETQLRFRTMAAQLHRVGCCRSGRELRRDTNILAKWWLMGLVTIYSWGKHFTCSWDNLCNAT